MKTRDDLAFETRVIHSGPPADPVTGATSPAIHQSSSYVFRDTDHAADVFALREKGYVYSRLTNPTVAALEDKIAALEGGAGATCTASGLAASLLAAYTLLSPGDEFVASQKLYGGTGSQFKDSFSRAFGWTCRFADPSRSESFKEAITEKTRFLFVESLSNPEGVIADIETLAHIAEDAGIPLIVDNTVPTPYLCQPLRHGASLVTHSTTKYLSGHGQAMGGCVVDGGTFDWMKHADRFPALTGTRHGYRDVIFARDFRDAPFAMHNHAVGLRDLGMNQQAMNAYLTLVCSETLALRVERHSANALKIARFLETHPQVAWVRYPGLETNPSHALAQQYMRRGMCNGLFTFGVKGGYESGRKLVETVRLFAHLANIGDTRSLIIHPASTTHAQLSDDHKINAGAGPDVVRVSIGIEDADDLIDDLNAALG